MTAAATEVRARRAGWTAAQWAIVVVAVVAGVAVRWVALGRARTSFDESFTGVLSRRALGDIPRVLAETDSHPPLDYVLRHLVAGQGDEFWLRAPSALVATLTVLVVLWWMRDRGWFGVLVVAGTSVAAIQVLYARQARMYALVILAGTAAAALSERWLGDRRARWAVPAAGALAVGLFSHTATAFFAASALLVAGLDRDRAAWVWRASVAAALVGWAAAWGPSIADQLDHDPAGWIPHTSLRTALEAVSGQVSLYDGLALLVVLAVVAGGVRLVRHDPALGRVWLCLFVLPAGALAAAGSVWHLLLPRSLAFAAWGPVVAVAALAAACVEDRPPWLTRRLGAVGLLACALLVVPSVGAAFRYEEDSAPARDRLAGLVSAGDAVGVTPAFLGPMLAWDHDLDPDDATGLAGSADGWSAVLPGAEPTGRIWVVVPETYSYEPPAGLEPCPLEPNRWFDGDLWLACYDVAPASTGGG